MKLIKKGIYYLGEYKESNIKTTLILNLNKGMLIFNNYNNGNAGSFVDNVKLEEIFKLTNNINCNKYENSKWYKLYRKAFACKGDIRKNFIKDYNNMIEKINEGLI